MNDGKTLFEKACKHIYSLEDLEKDLSLQSFMDSDEVTALSMSYYHFARDAMPREIVEFILGNIHIGYIMGRMACGENSDNIIPSETNLMDWTG